MPFNLEPHQLRVEKPWGHEIIWTPSHLARAGKLLFVKAGCRLSFQYHVVKEETLCLLSGDACLWLEDDAREIRKITMIPEQGYTVAPGQKHRIEALSDALLVEVSSPEIGDTIRLSDDYARSTETEADRNADRASKHS